MHKILVLLPRERNKAEPRTQPHQCLTDFLDFPPAPRVVYYTLIKIQIKQKQNPLSIVLSLPVLRMLLLAKS